MNFAGDVLGGFFRAFFLGKKAGGKNPRQNSSRNLGVSRPKSTLRADFWEGDVTKHFSVKKKGIFSEKGGGTSVNQGFGKDFYRKGNSVKRFGRFTEPPDSEN